jgi:uncharacterized protein YbjT (DUF2867 family)
MKLVVIGGSGRVGSKIVDKLREHGHDAVPASLQSGVNTITGEGLDDALAGADVVIDASNSPSFEDDAVMEFFKKSTTNLLAAEKREGVGHHVALSVVGTDKMSEGGYIRAKLAQEQLIKDGPIPYSLVHATQFFEFVPAIAASSLQGDAVHLPPVLFQPIAADEVAAAVAKVAVHAPLNGMAEVGGPEKLRLDETIRRALAAADDSREVVTDPDALYFGARVDDDTLVPGPGATLGETTFEEWLSEHPAATAARSS